ncbi:MAG: hypothetical protein KAI47_27395 [Deltaproteobacteria bacterium]|nr:hypothetical protein [Deltaproteobacteria bacterium]
MLVQHVEVDGVLPGLEDLEAELEVVVGVGVEDVWRGFAGGLGEEVDDDAVGGEPVGCAEETLVLDDAVGDVRIEMR